MRKNNFLINLHYFLPKSLVNGPGLRAVVWVQGCPRRCPGCFNPEAQPFVTRELVTVDQLFERIISLKGIDGVTFSGGEPFSQSAPLAELSKRLRERGLTIVCYTGFTLSELKRAQNPDWENFLAQIDLLIDGPYIESLRVNEPYRGSANQKFHFLSGRIRPEEVEKGPLLEIFLGSDGQIIETGFPGNLVK